MTELTSSEREAKRDLKGCSCGEKVKGSCPDCTPEGRLFTAMTACSLMPDRDHSMGGLLYSMERQVNCLQERVKFQIEMINRRDEEIERVRLEMFKRAQERKSESPPLTDLLLRWINIAENGKYGERTATPLKKHPIIAETISALSDMTKEGKCKA